LILECFARRDFGPRFNPRRVSEAIALRLETAQRAVLPRRRIGSRDDEIDNRGSSWTLRGRRIGQR